MGTSRRRAIVAATVLAAGLAVPIHQVSAATPALITGKVTSGGASIAGATVRLIAWSNGARLDRLSDGAKVSTRQIATTTTDADGNYSLAPDLATLPADYHDSVGSMNIDEEITGPRSVATYSFPAALPNTEAATVQSNAAVGTRADTISADLGAHTVTDSIRAAADAPTTDSLSVTTASASGAHPNDWDPNWCERVPWTAGALQPARPAAVLAVYGVPGGWATLHKNVGATHKLGVIFRVDGGDWGASGSITSEVNSGAGGDRTFTHGYRVYDEMNYRHFYRTCDPVQFGPSHHYGEYRSVSYHALLVPKRDVYIGPMPKGWGACDRYTGSVQPAHMYKIEGDNIEYAHGVSLAHVGASVEISSQDAYSHEQKEEFTFHRGKYAWLCGDDGRGWASARRAGTHR